MNSIVHYTHGTKPSQHLRSRNTSYVFPFNLQRAGASAVCCELTFFIKHILCFFSFNLQRAETIAVCLSSPFTLGASYCIPRRWCRIPAIQSARSTITTDFDHLFFPTERLLLAERLLHGLSFSMTYAIPKVWLLVYTLLLTLLTTAGAEYLHSIVTVLWTKDDYGNSIDRAVYGRNAQYSP